MSACEAAATPFDELQPHGTQPRTFRSTKLVSSLGCTITHTHSLGFSQARFHFSRTPTFPQTLIFGRTDCHAPAHGSECTYMYFPPPHVCLVMAGRWV